MTRKEIADLAIQTAVAIGTLGAVAAAIWGDWLRDHLAAPILKIELTDPIGSLLPIASPPGLVMTQSRTAFWVHGRVVNKRRWVTPKNCRVLLRTLQLRGVDGKFAPVLLSVPLRFVWSPSEITGPTVDVPIDHYFDFGRIIHPPFPGPDCVFVPVLYSVSNNFQGIVRAGGCLRFGLQVQADNYSRDDLTVIEVEWNGNWSEDPDQMRQNLKVAIIAAEPIEPEPQVI